MSNLYIYTINLIYTARSLPHDGSNSVLNYSWRELRFILVQQSLDDVWWHFINLYSTENSLQNLKHIQKMKKYAKFV